MTEKDALIVQLLFFLGNAMVFFANNITHPFSFLFFKFYSTTNDGRRKRKIDQWGIQNLEKELTLSLRSCHNTRAEMAKFDVPMAPWCGKVSEIVPPYTSCFVLFSIDDLNVLFFLFVVFLIKGTKFNNFYWEPIPMMKIPTTFKSRL